MGVDLVAELNKAVCSQGTEMEWYIEAKKQYLTACTFYQRILDLEAKLRDLKHRIKHGYEITKEELNRDE